jgi:RNA polymerase sigma factor (sigma-70 family)
MVEDAELIRRYAEEQSEGAFAELVQRHVPLVYSAALRRLAGDAHAAADVTQLVFTALARQAPSLVRCQVLPGWLYATTRNLAVDYIRSEHRRRAREQEAHAMHEPDSASPPPDWDQLRPLLDEVMDQLGQRDREAVLLRFFAHRSFSEIGQALNVTEDAARMRVDRAIEKLRAMLARRGATSTGAALGLMLSSQAATAAPAGIAGPVTSAALQSAAVASPALTLIELMSTSKIIAATGLALVFAIGFTVHEVRAARAAESLLAESQRNLTSLEGQVSRSQQRAAEAEGKLAGLRQAAAEDRAATEAEAPKAAKAKPDPVGTGKKFVEIHPETTTLITSHAAHRVTLLYGELLRRLNLTPAQIEQFRALALQREAGVRWFTATQQPYAEVNVGDLTRQQIDAQIKELLGPAGFAQYEEYSRNLLGQTRRLAEQIARSDYFTATPLTPGQGDRLTEIVAQNSPDFIAGRQVNLVTLDWDKTLAAAGSVLPAPQLAALAALRDKAFFDQAMRQQINQAVKDARAAAGVPPEY